MIEDLSRKRVSLSELLFIRNYRICSFPRSYLIPRPPSLPRSTSSQRYAEKDDLTTKISDHMMNILIEIFFFKINIQFIEIHKIMLDILILLLLSASAKKKHKTREYKQPFRR